MKLSVYTENRDLKVQAAGDTEAILAWTGEYGRGDVLRASDLKPGSWYQFRPDDSIAETLLYVTAEEFSWTIPFFTDKTRSAPLSFMGTRHYASIRRAEPFEVSAFRNLAFNPADRHEASGVYPHVHANAETGGNASFSAPNVIDGCKACLAHGEWPFQSLSFPDTAGGIRDSLRLKE